MPTLLIAGESSNALAREAVRLGRALLCPKHGDASPPHDPVSCGTCRRIAEGSHPDFLRVSPEGAAAAIKVEAVRDAIRFAAGRPYEAPARVVWIEGAETLREGSAAHALLKSLEEPGGFVTWILTTTAPAGLLPTILSRCQLRRLRRPTEAERRAAWRARGLDASAVEDALAFGFDPGGDADLEASRELRRAAVEALGAEGLSALLDLAATAADDETAPALVSGLLRDAAVLAAGGPAERVRHRAVASGLAAIARRHPPAALRRAAVEVDALPDRFTRFVLKRLAWEDALLELARP